MSSKIKAVAVTEFEFIVDNIGLEQAAAGVGNMAYVKGGKFPARRFAVRITTDEGVDGGKCQMDDCPRLCHFLRTGRSEGYTLIVLGNVKE